MKFSSDICDNGREGRFPDRSSAAIVHLNDLAPRPRRVAIGKFDGVHLGHRAAISGADAVCTFDPHPLAVLDPDGAPPLLTSVERRAQLVGALGVAELVVLPFDDAMRSLSPDAFVADVLLGRLGATHVRVGVGFRFGHRASGTAAMLEADPRLTCRTVEAVVAGGATVSSTRIRALVAAGAVAEAAELLGAPHAVPCTSAPAGGADEGRLLLVPHPGLAIPARGVYAARLRDAGRPRASVPCAVSVSADAERPTLLAGAIGQPAIARHVAPGAGVLVEFLDRVSPAARAPRVDRRARATVS